MYFKVTYVGSASVLNLAGTGLVLLKYMYFKVKYDLKVLQHYGVRVLVRTIRSFKMVNSVACLYPDKI